MTRHGAFIVVAAVLLAAGCGGKGTGTAALVLEDFSFQPTAVSGDPEQKVMLTLRNVGAVEHNLTVEDQGVDRDVGPGQTATVTVTMPDSDHVVRFFCKYHRDQGMTGLLGEGGYFPGG